MSLVNISQTTTLEHALSQAIEGEVRFDKVSRALYSTDASVYQIEPIGVAVPKTRRGHHPHRRTLPPLPCPITMRGGGTSQAGQAIGEGLQSTLRSITTRYSN